MSEQNCLPRRIVRGGVAGLFIAIAAASLWGQTPNADAQRKPSDSMDVVVHELQQQVQELRAAVTEMRSEAAQYRAETAELRRELESTRTQLPAGPGLADHVNPAENLPGGNEKINEQIAALEETTQLLGNKVDEQYQTKIEGASKYRVRLSGLVLLNLFGNRGNTNNPDFPEYVPPASPLNSGSAFGATLRQSEFGLEVFGPRLAGARTSGSLQVDFSGGFPSTLNGVSYGLLRLRTASMRMDWQNTSVVVGQDNLFLSPQSPTSFASIAVPALGYQGNLWGWIPQVRVEHRFNFSDDQNFLVQAGIMDNLTGEPPFAQFDRTLHAGESSGQPAYGVRTAWAQKLFGETMTLGTAGYYSRQNWRFDRNVDGWAGMIDLDVPLSHQFYLSGEFYRGRAVGGLAGGIGRSTLYSGSIFDPATRIIGLDSVGGWAQLKYRATSKLEFNGAFGVDNPMADDVRAFPVSVSYFDPTLVRNRAALFNFVYRPRSNLLFSSEYRRLRTYEVDNGSQSAGQMNLVMGIIF